MQEQIKRLLSLGLIILLLVKGLSSLLPLVSSSLKGSLLTEIQIEPEQEKQKKSGSKAVETELIEDFFEKPHFCHAELSPFTTSLKCTRETNQSLQMVHLDITTPPPDALHA